MERGSAKHGPWRDEALVQELRGILGRPGGSNRAGWADPEPLSDDDAPSEFGTSPEHPER